MPKLTQSRAATPCGSRARPAHDSPGIRSRRSSSHLFPVRRGYGNHVTRLVSSLATALRASLPYFRLQLAPRRWSPVGIPLASSPPCAYKRSCTPQCHPKHPRVDPRSISTLSRAPKPAGAPPRAHLPRRTNLLGRQRRTRFPSALLSSRSFSILPASSLTSPQAFS